MLIDISGIIGVPHDWLAPKMCEIIMNPLCSNAKFDVVMTPGHTGS